MAKKTLKALIASSLFVVCGAALAVPFNSFDPRSMGMGGAGVAVGDAKMAPFFNPALLTITPDEDDFSLALPIVGARVYDPSEFSNSLDNFQQGNYINALQTSINNYNAAPSSAALVPVANDISTLSTQLSGLSDKPIQGELGAGLVIGIPSKSFGVAVYANGWQAIGGVIRYKDDQTLQDFATAAGQVAACNNNAACIAALPPSVTQYFNTATGQVTFNTTTGLASSVDIRGVGFSEVGIAMSSEFDFAGGIWGIGITPKIIKATLFDYSADVNSGNTGNVTDSDYTEKYSGFNFDLGVAQDFDNGWHAGFVVKNVIPQNYDFKRIATGAPAGSAKITSGTFKLKPQARIGAAHSTDWSTLAMDLDLTTNDPAGFEKPSQFLGIGAELDAWGWAQVRVGYRANLKDSARNVSSVGVGLGPLDVSVASTGNELGAALSLGFTF